MNSSTAVVRCMVTQTANRSVNPRAAVDSRPWTSCSGRFGTAISWHWATRVLRRAVVIYSTAVGRLGSKLASLVRYPSLLFTSFTVGEL